MARRGENIYKRKDGRWEGRYKDGFKPDGKTKYSSVYGKTYAEVRSAMACKRLKQQAEARYADLILVRSSDCGLTIFAALLRNPLMQIIL